MEYKKHNVLVLGSGGREHAIIKKIKNSKILGQLYTNSKNPLWHQDAQPLDVGNCDKDFIELTYSCKSKDIDMVIIGQEKYLANGITEALAQENIKAFGPSAAAARLESLKSFTRELCSMHNIPAPEYWHFVNQANAEQFIKSHDNYPLVIKADGLAAGKGVIICNDVKAALEALQKVFSGELDQQGKSVVIEEFLEGSEFSFFVLVDGQNIVPLGAACDYKQVKIGDKVFNTGGMASYSPPFDHDSNMDRLVMRSIIYPTINALYSMGIEYKGVLFAGIMVHNGQPKLLEYNVRFGDPETQCILPRLESDLLEIVINTVNGDLRNDIVRFNDKASVCLVMANNGYPIRQSEPSIIKNLQALENIPGIEVLHAGTDYSNGNIMAVGGRVINIVATAKDLRTARDLAYKAIQQIDWPGGFYLKEVCTPNKEDLVD